MADKMRSINTRFWDDTFVEELTVSEKLLFLYLLTNSLTNLLGIYEISIKRISYETGLNKDTIEKAFKRFETVRKVYYVDNFIIMPNFLKNQNLNANMKKGVVKLYENLPKWLKDSINGNGSKGFESVSNALGKYEIEIERESEEEIEEEEKDINVVDQYLLWKSESEDKVYNFFIEWILEEKPTNCFKLKDQLDINKFIKITELDSYSPKKIKDTIVAMNNYKKLLTNNVSFYSTLRVWMSK